MPYGTSSGIFVLVIFLLVILAFMVFPRAKSKGKALCYFLEATRTTSIKLLKVEEEHFIKDGELKFWFEEEKVRYFRYPSGWPSIFQITVPGLLVDRRRGEAMDWNDLPDPGASPREMGAVMDPVWMAMVVKGVKEGVVPSRLEKILPLLAVALSGLTLLFLFYLYTKLGAIESAVEVLKP